LDRESKEPNPDAEPRKNARTINRKTSGLRGLHGKKKIKGKNGIR